MSKTKNTEQNIYAVIIYAEDIDNYLESKIVTINKAQKDSTYLVHLGQDKNNITFTLREHNLLFFKSYQLALDFQTKYLPYMGVYITSAESKSLYETRDLNSAKVGTIPAFAERKVISPLITPDNQDELEAKIIYNDQSFWIRTQYYNQLEDKFERGWEVIIDTTKAIYKFDNPLNISLMWEQLPKDKKWQIIDIYSDSINLFGDSVLYLEEDKENPANKFINITNKDTSININISNLIPVEKYVAVYPSQNIYLKWDIKESTIIVQYPDKSLELYTPLDDRVLLSQKKRLLTNVSEAYKTLTQNNTTNNNYILWKSDLFGILRTSYKRSYLVIDFNWNIPIEISELYFPKKTENVTGTFNFTHYPSPELLQDIDTILTLNTTLVPEPIYLGLKIINNNTIGIQFISEANVLSKIKKSNIISAQPANPRMVFKRSSIDINN